ncbi:MAG TPA: putative quinol monooxygenase [Burkholderiaceae bacterium]|nr:putative quinol monooxygenase [Burkholderiaceae bacterium]
MIIVTGTLHARPDALAEVLRLSREHVQRSRAEPGCLEHGVAIDADDPLRLVFFERWADHDAIGAHLRLPASRGFGKAVAALVDQPPTLAMFDATALPGR